MKKTCACKSPLLRAHTPRYPTAAEKERLRVYLLHARSAGDAHHPTPQELKKAERQIASGLIVVYDTPVPHSPKVMNVFWDSDPDPSQRKDFLVYDAFVVPVPELQLDLMVAMDMQVMDDTDTRDAEQVTLDTFKEYVEAGKGYFAH